MSAARPEGLRLSFNKKAMDERGIDPQNLKNAKDLLLDTAEYDRAMSERMEEMKSVLSDFRESNEKELSSVVGSMAGEIYSLRMIMLEMMDLLVVGINPLIREMKMSKAIVDSGDQDSPGYKKAVQLTTLLKDGLIRQDRFVKILFGDGEKARSMDAGYLSGRRDKSILDRIADEIEREEELERER